MVEAPVQPAPPPATLARRGRRYIPSLPDFLFCAMIFWLFMTGEGWKSLLLDGDSGWHIRTGESILATGQVPNRDPFSFSRAGETWFAWEWLADVALGAAHRVLELQGVVLLAGVTIAATFWILFRHCLWRGGNPVIALFLVILASGAASVHYHARPHLATFVLFALSLWMIERDRREPSGWRGIWWLVPMAALWTNLHGGFLALVAVLGLAGVGELLEGRFGKAGQMAFGRARRYLLLAGACMAASLVNPFGYHLHEHIVTYLRSDWIIDSIDEFRSPDFRGEVMRQYEVLLFGGIALAGYLVTRRRFVEPLLILFWAQASLTSVRHVPLFALVAVPALCEALTQLWTLASASASRRSVVGILRDVGRDLALAPRALSIWPFVFVAGLAASEGSRWPRDFPEQVFPVGLVERHASLLAPAEDPSRKLFAPDGWGGYLIYRFHPRLRVFTDGRSDFYGRELGLEYVRMLNGRHDWEALMDRYGFDLALIPVKVPLAELLKRHPGWTVVEDDGKAILFEKVAVSLMDSGISAERLSRPSSAGENRG